MATKVTLMFRVSWLLDHFDTECVLTNKNYVKFRCKFALMERRQTCFSSSRHRRSSQHLERGSERRLSLKLHISNQLPRHFYRYAWQLCPDKALTLLCKWTTWCLMFAVILYYGISFSTVLHHLDLLTFVLHSLDLWRKKSSFLRPVINIKNLLHLENKYKI